MLVQDSVFLSMEERLMIKVKEGMEQILYQMMIRNSKYPVKVWLIIFIIQCGLLQRKNNSGLLFNSLNKAMDIDNVVFGGKK